MNPTSIVDLLKSSGKSSDLASRAKLAVDYGIVKTPEEYITKANTGQNAQENLSLIQKLKETGGSMSSPTAPVNANSPVSAPISNISSNVSSMLQKDQKQPILDSNGNVLATWNTAMNNYRDNKTGLVYQQQTPTTQPNPKSPQKPIELTDEEIQKQAQEQSKPFESTLKASNDYKKQLNEQYRQNEIDQAELSIKHANDMLLNSLASRGILGNSTESQRLIKEQDNENDLLRKKINDKYNLANSGLSSELSSEISARLEKEIQKIKDKQKEKLANYYSETTLVQKALADQRESELKQKQLDLDTKYKNNQITLDQYNAETNRLKANADIAKTTAEKNKIESENTVKGTGTIKGTSDQIDLMEKSLKNAEELSGASGRSGLRKGIESWLVGSTDYTNLVAETNTLRTNLLTLATDPNIKKFFGPQMSNADVKLMTSAGTTLDPELQDPVKLKDELTRIKDLVKRMKESIPQEKYILPDGTIVTLQQDGTYK